MAQAEGQLFVGHRRKVGGQEPRGDQVVGILIDELQLQPEGIVEQAAVALGVHHGVVAVSIADGILPQFGLQGLQPSLSGDEALIQVGAADCHVAEVDGRGDAVSKERQPMAPTVGHLIELILEQQLAQRELPTVRQHLEGRHAGEQRPDGHLALSLSRQTDLHMVGAKVVDGVHDALVLGIREVSDGVRLSH